MTPCHFAREIAIAPDSPAQSAPQATAADDAPRGGAGALAAGSGRVRRVASAAVAWRTWPDERTQAFVRRLFHKFAPGSSSILTAAPPRPRARARDRSRDIEAAASGAREAASQLQVPRAVCSLELTDRMLQLLLLVLLLESLQPLAAAAAEASIPLDWAANATGRRFDGIGGLSGGGATSTFLLAYKEPQRSQIMDWMFKPDYGASLQILKVEVGSDDQTTDGCEGCHMRSPTEVDCHRGYEWGLMKEAAARNPEIILYGLPWAWAGWLGFGTNSPYANVTATADYTAKWIECGRDAHSLNISVIGLWNEEPGPIPYILALRKRLDEGGLQHVKIIAPDGGGSGMDEVAVRNRFFAHIF